MKQAIISSPLGKIRVIGDATALYQLEFDSDSTENEIENGRNILLDSIEDELDQYFKKRLKKFKTPISFNGTPFQNRVWNHLLEIPFGNTISYSQLAKALGSENYRRAVGGANNKNRLAIIVPCHRVVQASGQIGGYSSGMDKKRWLLEHEK